MADLQKTIEIIFSGTDKNLKAVTKGLQSDVKGFSDSVYKVADPVADFTKNILQMEAVIAALAATMAAVAIFGSTDVLIIRQCNSDGGKCLNPIVSFEYHKFSWVSLMGQNG